MVIVLKLFIDYVVGNAQLMELLKQRYTKKSQRGGEIQYISDNNAFIFSLDNKNKYNIKNPSKAIGIGSDYLLFFGYMQGVVIITQIIQEKEHMDLIQKMKMEEYIILL